MSRSYRNVRPKSQRVYDVAEVMALFGISRNTLSNWNSMGLRSSDSLRNQVFRGAELIRFHASRRALSETIVRRCEFLCWSCDTASIPALDTIVMPDARSTGRMARARCPNCGMQTSKLLSAGGGVGNKPVVTEAIVHTANDRIIHSWQIYAGRYDPKTIDAHLHSIREFERFVNGKRLDTVTWKEAAAYRDSLVERSRLPRADGGLSNSTVRHRASQISAFFTWLLKQDGDGRLNQNIPDNFKLSNAQMAQALTRDARGYPTGDEVQAMVEGMQTGHLRERRDRAIVATAFAFGIRADALISLRIKLVDLEHQEIRHDASEIRAKNGKSFVIYLFPKSSRLFAILKEWIAELLELGLCGDDALFPSDNDLKAPRRTDSAERISIDPMKTAGAVATAFVAANRTIGICYTPHSARHYLAALGRSLCLTSAQKEAWSKNLGHEKQQTTERYYGKMKDTERREEIDALRSPLVFPDEDKDLMLDYHEHRLRRDSPEWLRARKLVNEREGRDRAPVLDDR